MMELDKQKVMCESSEGLLLRARGEEKMCGKHLYLETPVQFAHIVRP